MVVVSQCQTDMPRSGLESAQKTEMMVTVLPLFSCIWLGMVAQ